MKRKSEKYRVEERVSSDEEKRIAQIDIQEGGEKGSLHSTTHE